MDQKTKDVLFKNKALLNDKALEKRKEINKKILKYFAYTMLILVLIIMTGAILSGSSKENAAKNSVNLEQFSVENSVTAYPKDEGGVFTEIVDNPALEPIVISSDIPAAKAVLKFLSAWQKSDWASMNKYTQSSWRARETNPERFLSSRFGDLGLLGVEFKGVEQISAADDKMVVVVVSLRYSYPPLVKTETIKIRCIYEGGWGVNPVSVNIRGRNGIALEAYDIQSAL